MPLESLVSNMPFLSGAKFRAGWAEREYCVCRVLTAPANQGGTGFLIGPDLLMTCFHVIQDFISPDGKPIRPLNAIVCKFDASTNLPSERSLAERNVSVKEILHARSPSSADLDGEGDPALQDLDYALLRLQEPVGDERSWFEFHDFSPIANAFAGQPVQRFLSILQHPGLRDQATAFNFEEVSLNSNNTRIRYRVNTEPGSSGSPCCDENWNLIAVHHAGKIRVGSSEFNQGVPVQMIASDLKDRGFDRLIPKSRDLMTQDVSAANRVPRDPNREALIVICAQSDHDRAFALLEQARIPPDFVLQVGNVPPAEIGDRLICLYLGCSEAMADSNLQKTVAELSTLRVPIIPVVTDSKQWENETPQSLRDYNAVAWPLATSVPEPLARRIRQLLGLEVAPRDRTVFISYSRQDAGDYIRDLKSALESKNYQVFLDLDDMPIAENVQEEIDRRLSKYGQKAVLYVETENSHASKWIYQEILWAKSRNLGFVVYQPKPVRRRMPLVTSLQLIAPHNQPPAQAAGEIAAWLDQEIARTYTSTLHLGRMLEAVVNTCELPWKFHVELDPDDPGLQYLVGKRIIGEREKGKCMVVRNSPRTPTVEEIQNLCDLVVKKPKGAEVGILLFEGEQRQISELEETLFRKIVGDVDVWWISRELVKQKLCNLLKDLS